MEISKKELEHALEIVKPGLANKDIVEQATSFAFVKGKVVTYNDEISVSHPVAGLDIAGAVEADILYKLLSKAKSDTLNLQVEENQITLTQGKMQAGFSLQSEIKLPINEEVSDIGKWKKLPDKFSEFLELSIPSASKDMSRPVLTCVHVSKDGYMEASDSFCLTRCTFSDDVPVKTFLIPATSAIQVIRLSPTQIAEGKGWIHFKNEEESVISCRVLADSFPDASHLLNVEGHKLILPEAIPEALDRASIVAKRDHPLEEMVTVEIKDKTLLISSDSKESWFKEELRINFKEHLKFNITPYLLKRILSKTRECTVSENKLKFEGEGWIYIAALRV